MPTTVSAWLFSFLGLVAGLSFVFQQAVNASLRAEIGSPWWAGFVSYLGGTLAMLAAAIVVRQPFPTMDALRQASWTSWLGGAFGAIYIAISILMLPRVGAATLLALIIVGQMLGSMGFDQLGLLAVPHHTVTWQRAIGAALLVSGAALICFY